MKITKVNLQNIRSHTDSEIKIENGINVIAGRTGSGKSSVLMAIEYALFGSESGTSNSAILRRGCQEGKISLEMEERGDKYTIIRGLKRQGKNITINLSNMSILKNGDPLPLLGRAMDLNSKVLEIINYPKDIKPKNLFEITSYTKQDELRNLIEMGAEKRQELIDKILQLSKYKETWENLKDVISHFSDRLKEKNIRLERFKEIQEETIKLELKTLQHKKSINDNETNLKKLIAEQKNIEIIIQSIKDQIKELLLKRRELDQIKGKTKSLEEEIKKFDFIKEAFKTRLNELNEKLNAIGEVTGFQELQIKNIEMIKDIENLQKEIIKVKDEMQNTEKLGEGDCPVCKQKVTVDHISSLKKEFENKILEYESKLESKRIEQQKIEPEMRKSKLRDELKSNLEKTKENFDEKTKLINEKKKSLINLNEKISELKFDDTTLNKEEKRLIEVTASEKELFSTIGSLEKINSLLESELKDLTGEFEKKKELIDRMEKDREQIKKMENGINIITRLREDIRNIREIIRRNFLEDFRQEFQKKFEEIRSQEQEYVVDIKKDYEPITFTSEGETVPIANLSGGEKTSIALSYRLSLANLAAQISSINPSELLILDEPTTGLDQEDIKALPNALRNIQTIPQILIVTHEEELKNAADYKFDVRKQDRVSFIESSD